MSERIQAVIPYGAIRNATESQCVWFPASGVFSAIVTNIVIGIETDEDQGAMTNILGNFHESFVFTGTVVAFVLVFVYFYDNHLISQVTEQIGAAFGTTVGDFFVVDPGLIRK